MFHRHPAPSADGSAGRPAAARLASLVLFAFAPWIASCASLGALADAVPRPTASLEQVRVARFALDALTLELDMNIENPLSTDVPLVDVDVALSSSGAEFLSGNFPLQGLVPARGSRTVTVPVRLDVAQTLRTLGSVRPGQVIDYRADVDLSLDVPALGTIALPLGHEGLLPVPAPPSISVGGFRWDEMSLQSVRGTVALDLVNPNEFAFAIEGLDLGLTIAGRKVGDLTASAGPSIRAQGEGTIELPIALRPLDVGTAVLDVLRGSEAGYGLSGALSVGTAFGPLRLPVDVSGTAPVSGPR